jgi:tetratricopeptide (TPR) repeat protein
MEPARLLEEDWPERSPRLEQQEDPVNRRKFLQAAAVTSVGLTTGLPSLDWERLASLPGQLDDQVLGQLAALTGEYARRSHTQMAQPLLVATHNHLAFLESLMDRSRPAPLERQLRLLGGEAARLAGWLSYLVENRPAANAYYDRGLELAQAGGDGVLVGRLLVAKSLLYSSLAEDVDGATGTTGTVIGMLQQAIAAAGSEGPARLTVWGHERLAVEYAAGGDALAANRALERAHTLLDVAPRQAGGLPNNWDSVWLDAYSANVFRILGRPREAVARLESALGDVDPEFGYDQSVFWSSLGVAYAQLRPPEIEGACAALSRSLSLALERRLAGRVQRVIGSRHHLTPWESSPHVQRLDQELEAARW